jgi:hypothetical protein
MKMLTTVTPKKVRRISGKRNLGTSHEKLNGFPGEIDSLREQIVYERARPEATRS